MNLRLCHYNYYNNSRAYSREGNKGGGVEFVDIVFVKIQKM